MASQKELRLVAAVVAGDSSALEAFVAGYRVFVYAILTRHLSLSPVDADEVFQRFLIHIWEDEFRRLRHWSGRGTLAAYIGVMVRNLGHDYRRERRRELPLEDVVLREAAAPPHGERVQSVRAAVAKLPHRDRELIRRRYDMGESYKEIASGLRITVSNVGVALHRAEKRLRKLLADAL